ncbi:uncharacterized protein PHALS_14742 [Plasmopara halstedii]|uniref:Uncharacterized protein n=1 Tax=Plasmopara halstedii TaxID=4781 RepID=A0A0P1AR45_PLAHL|nr:uncharacterized protein PHALS_14742 [Plasmopara halstedii]CEG43742.1 hypothetical protein PHALS_14742 [Plasmopara halstedii]|eukprot:XP_024580111.1 hypothetical protein PHALS_14742 [Plasmopara halstedii]
MLHHDVSNTLLRYTTHMPYFFALNYHPWSLFNVIDFDGEHNRSYHPGESSDFLQNVMYFSCKRRNEYK